MTFTTSRRPLARWHDGSLLNETAIARSDAWPELLDEVYGAMLPGSDRRRTGSFLTPAGVAARLCALAMPSSSPAPRVLAVCDPAVGGGSFLIAAARRR